MRDCQRSFILVSVGLLTKQRMQFLSVFFKFELVATIYVFLLAIVFLLFSLAIILLLLALSYWFEKFGFKEQLCSVNFTLVAFSHVLLLLAMVLLINLLFEKENVLRGNNSTNCPTVLPISFFFFFFYYIYITRNSIFWSLKNKPNWIFWTKTTSYMSGSGRQEVVELSPFILNFCS